MLYEKNTQKPHLDPELFRNPGAEYRATPFWAWNCKLDREELLRQIDIFKEMGLGGFHMHVRTGLEDEYLGETFMEHVRACVEHAKETDMLAWLYDEDRWPSGYAGGIVTKNKQLRQKYILFTCREDYCPPADACLLGIYDVCLGKDKTLSSYCMIEDGDAPTGTAWKVYRIIAPDNPRFNGQAYLDTLDDEAVQAFIAVTHERYRAYFADEFGGVIPAIFTDEPQFSHKQTLAFADSRQDVTLPWTDRLEAKFFEKYNYSLIAHLPELLWDLPDDRVSVVRYHYHDFVAECFASAFADQCGAWCAENGLALTGHMMKEPTLYSQTLALGDTMRSYRSFHIPGIDMLCAKFEFTTAKQAQSATRQYGCPGMMSELYGVTSWDFDFRGHKLHGDWQAAMGVTVRVPHLSWVSMKGDAKRDYPASISYQSSWYKEYAYIEDHFARLNTALTRGKPMVRVGVIHPVESYWLHWGPTEQTALARSGMDDNFLSLTEWLLRGNIDFDFICESLLPEQCTEGGAPLKVGRMAYDVVIVPECETIRSTTLERLEAFAEQGGKLIFMGDAPKYENAIPSARGMALYEKGTVISFNRSAVLKAIEPYRTVEIRNKTGNYATNLIHQLRRDTDGIWLFISHCDEPRNKDIPQKGSYRITLKGKHTPKRYDTQTGEIYPLPAAVSDDCTSLEIDLYEYDSALIYFEDADNTVCTPEVVTGRRTHEYQLPDSSVSYSLDEPNVYLFDMVEMALDDEDFAPLEEILRADGKMRERLGYPRRIQAFAQPWVISDTRADHTVTLRFTVQSEIPLIGAEIALEDADVAEVTVNGLQLEKRDTGYYTDRSIRKLALPDLPAGRTVITVKLPYGVRKYVEACYLLGQFGVEVNGRERKITALPERLSFDDITRQKLPYYGGSVTYHLPLDRSEDGRLGLRIPHYRAAVLTASLDGKKLGCVVYPPYEISLGKVKAGTHQVDVKAYISRHNCFGNIHNADRLHPYPSPSSWFSTGSEWTYEYRLKEQGIISTPIVYVEE